MKILCDETGVIGQVKEPMSHHVMKHKRRDFYYIWDVVERQDIVI